MRGQRGRRVVVLSVVAVFAAVVLVVAVFAFYAAYQHSYEVASHHGQEGATAVMTAALPDLLALVASLYVALALWLGLSVVPGVVVLVVAVALTVGGQVGSVQPSAGWVAYVVAVVPAGVFLLLLWLSELLVRSPRLGELLRRPAAPAATRGTAPKATRKAAQRRQPERPAKRQAGGATGDKLWRALRDMEPHTTAALAATLRVDQRTVQRHLTNLGDRVEQTPQGWRRTPAVRAVQ